MDHNTTGFGEHVDGVDESDEYLSKPTMKY